MNIVLTDKEVAIVAYVKDSGFKTYVDEFYQNGVKYFDKDRSGIVHFTEDFFELEYSEIRDKFITEI